MKYLGKFSYNKRKVKGWPFKNSHNEYSELNTQRTNPDLVINNAIDGMTIFNYEFKFQNATNEEAAKQY